LPEDIGQETPLFNVYLSTTPGN